MSRLQPCSREKRGHRDGTGVGAAKAKEDIMQKTAIPAALLLLPVSLFAQWVNVKTPGIPRTPDGKPNLTAPVPRTADGRPDLSGLWTPGPNLYWVDLMTNIKDEAIFTPRAQAIFQKRAAEYLLDAPSTRCLPLGPGDILTGAYRIIQSPTEVALLRSGAAGDRQIFVDGRELPKDPDPTWKGYSVGHWEGDTLVAETSGFNNQGWLDNMGHPRSEKLHVTERFRRVDFGHIQFQISFDDPDTFAKPLTISLPMNYLADSEPLEFVCNENERDRAHFVAGELKPKIQLPAPALAKYAGTYETGDTTISLTISLVNDQLYVRDLPLFPQSETLFDSRLAPIEFSMDASGEVTGLTIIGAVGDEFRFVRKR
jgi:hypothetical protein